MENNTSLSSILNDVYQIILDRKQNLPENSYTTSLFNKGLDKILKKIGEEAGEVIIASKNDEKSEIVHEITDLWFHSLVLMGYHDVSLEDIYQEFLKRYKK